MSKKSRAMTVQRLARVLDILAKEAKAWDVPVISFLAAGGASPFRILVATVMSARTKDETTAAAAKRLFKLAGTPKAMNELSEKEIADAINPVGFYKTKAKNIKKLTQVLLEEYGAHVPDDLETLCTLPGVGRKTANLVLIQAFDKPAICVDTHVHRISNIWGFVDTPTPEKTEMALREKLPKRRWKTYNRILVAFGQQICVPVSPWCSKCPVEQFCPKIGVDRNR